ncbi:hypothetical protein N9155_00100 [bacterium]|nr:hypothetical protein [bacterium]
MTSIIRGSDDFDSADKSFEPTTVTGATPSLDVGTYNYFKQGTLTANTTVSFASVPTNASWTYTATGALSTTAGYDLTIAAIEKSFSTSTQDAYPTSVNFSTDGIFMYVLGQAGDDVNQYTLSTAFDVSTAVFTRLFSIAAKDTDPTNLSFSSDGTEMYIIGLSSLAVHQYTLSTAWNISTATFTRSFSVSAQDTSPRGLEFSPDGVYMYMSGITGDDVNQYTLSTAWNISTATYTRLFSTAAQDNSPLGVRFKPDGLKMYIIGGQYDTIYQYTLSTAWNISTASYDSVSFSVAGDDNQPQGMAFNADGTRMYVVGQLNAKVYQYITTPYLTLTLPASVVDAPSTAIGDTTVTYDFVTTDGGTTVSFLDATPYTQPTTYDAVGTYLLARPALSSPDIEAGATVAGSTLEPCALSGSTTNQVPSGTWRLMGKSDLTSSGATARGSLWVRIS